MPSPITLLAIPWLMVASLSSCGRLGAGSHVYCETVTVACSSGSVIQRLSELKSRGRFDDARSFPDGLGGDTWVLHNFYFYVPERQFLIRMEVPLHTPKDTELHLAGIKDFTSNSEWLGFADAPTEKRKAVLTWFNRVIRTALACNPPKSL